MRRLYVLAVAIVLATPSPSAQSAPTRGTALSTPEAILGWMNTYRTRPDPSVVPQIVKALSRAGTLRDPESAGVYVGFVAGVLGSNPNQTEQLLHRMLPLPPEDQWLAVRAVAYSGLPNWRHVLNGLSGRLPARRAMIAKYVGGDLPSLFDLAPEREKSAWEKVKQAFGRDKRSANEKNWALDMSPELLDTLWGYYFATGGYGPLVRIVAMLPWSKEKDNVEKLMLGAMAKFTLARNASRDDMLLTQLRRVARHQDKDTGEVLRQVIDAADIAETGRIRTEALAALETLKRQGPGSKREMATWARVAEGTVGLGCVAAAVTGQVAMGLPCVLGGAATSATVRYLAQ
jgi:hypothetical protein